MGEVSISNFSQFKKVLRNVKRGVVEILGKGKGI